MIANADADVDHESQDDEENVDLENALERGIYTVDLLAGVQITTLAIRL